MFLLFVYKLLFAFEHGLWQVFRFLFSWEVDFALLFMVLNWVLLELGELERVPVKLWRYVWTLDILQERIGEVAFV